MSLIGYARVSTSEGKQKSAVSGFLKTKHRVVIPNVKAWMIVSIICEKAMC